MTGKWSYLTGKPSAGFTCHGKKGPSVVSHWWCRIFQMQTSWVLLGDSAAKRSVKKCSRTSSFWIWWIWRNVGKTMPCLPSPSHHHFHRWYGYHPQSWVVNDIVLPTLYVFWAPFFMTLVLSGARTDSHSWEAHCRENPVMVSNHICWS